MVDTPFFPSQPLLDPLVPTAVEGATHGAPSWEMMYKVDLNPPNYPQRMQEQQEKIYQEKVRQAALKGEQPPPPPPVSNSAHPPVSNSAHPPPLPSIAEFVPLPPIKSGPNLRALLPDPAFPSKSDSSSLQRKPTVVRPPPEGWGPLPPVAPPAPLPLSYQLGVRTANVKDDPSSPTYAGMPKSPISPKSPITPITPKSPTVFTAPSCLEPELAEETERFLTLLFIQFPIQTLFPLTQKRGNNGGISSWMSMSKLGRSLTLMKN
ncbi:hypothetical protein BGZ65_005798 [Modicella reniformis]|uniref:Uncharacterized protein n=1 Tax=Modicella reniformis TaxID=1440133 RepID=A0A9P6LYM7_9FUNG|nr:hypothetical protein BGZ65_005798 [Modicella reniformis]